MHSSNSVILETGIPSGTNEANLSAIKGDKAGQLCSPAWKNSVSFLLDNRDDGSGSNSVSMDECAHFVAHHEPDIKGIRQRCPPQAVLILTPVVPHPPVNVCGNVPRDVTMDPFEPLGRAIAERHDKPVFHVPYVPAVGLTSKHEVFLREAGAVIVIVCEPTRFSAAESSVRSQLSSACQHAFSGNTVNFLRAEFEELSDVRPPKDTSESNEKMPTPLLIYIASKLTLRGEQDYAEEMRSRGFRNVIHANCYTPRALHVVSDLIFG